MSFRHHVEHYMEYAERAMRAIDALRQIDPRNELLNLVDSEYNFTSEFYKRYKTKTDPCGPDFGVAHGIEKFCFELEKAIKQRTDKT